MEKQKVTIYDIAYRAGVSQSTVSRVLSGSTKVNEDKRQAVLAAVEELGYKPNLFAQRLAQGGSPIVGILSSDTQTPFFTQVISGIQLEIAQSPYLPLIVSVQGMGDVGKAVELLRASRVGGVCVVGQPLPPATLALLQEEMLVYAVCPDTPGIEAKCLLVDNEGGGYRATRHLLELGHRQIAHVSGPRGHKHAVDRLAGYKRALKEFGVPFDEALVTYGNFSEATGLAATNELLARKVPFTALFAANDTTAFGAQLALYEHGLHVPTDVSLVGFDDTPQAAYRTPPLTTVRQPAADMGAAVARQVIGALSGQEVMQDEAFETPLVVRASTAPPRVRI